MNRSLTARLDREQGARDKEIEVMQRQRDEAQSRVGQIQTQLAESQRLIGVLTEPQLKARVLELPEETRAQRPTFTLPAGLPRVTIIIPARTLELNYFDYAISIENTGGTPVLNENGLRKDPEGDFTIELSCSSLPAGEYRFRVYGIRRGSRSLVWENIVRIRYE